MLQRLIYSARVNVFESARFYYGVLAVLTFHLLLRHSISKIFIVNGESELLFSKAVTAILYAVIYGCCIVSAILLRKQISKHFLYTWFIICFISICNEIVFLLTNINDYDLMISVTSGQMYTNIRFTFPILFLGVWSSLENSTMYSFNFLKLVYKVTLLNSLLVCVGVIFDLSLFESYPNSGRWGYSGLISNVYSVIFSSLFLISKIDRSKFDFRHVLLIISLLFSGTKSGILSLTLILLIVAIKSLKLRRLILAAIVLLLAFSSSWLPIIVSYNPFWENVYSKHGFWGVFSSLRNKNFIEFMYIIENSSVFNWILGGGARFEDFWVEILPADIFMFYGSLGLFVMSWFYFRLIQGWKVYIPFIVGLLNGSFLIVTFAFVTYGIWAQQGKGFSE
jgi:hypothetical protein